MKTIINAKDEGTFILEDPEKLSLKQAMKEHGLNPKEWKLEETKDAKTRVTYNIARIAGAAAASRNRHARAGARQPGRGSGPG